MASLLVENDEKKRRKTGAEESRISQLPKLPNFLLVFMMDFLRGDCKCWASLLGTCKYVHNHHVNNLVKLKILWEKAQRKRALYNCYFYTTINLWANYIGAAGAKYVAEALKVNTSLTEINLFNNNIGAEGAKYVAEALKVNTSLTKIHFYAHRPLVFLK